MQTALEFSCKGGPKQKIGQLFYGQCLNVCCYNFCALDMKIYQEKTHQKPGYVLIKDFKEGTEYRLW